MAEFTIQQLLAQRGMADRILDSQLTRKIARELRKKGFKRIRRGTIHVWTNEGIDRNQIAKEITEGL